MIRKTFYLEAPARTQHLLDAQQALRATECAIGSTWHDETVMSHAADPNGDWIAERLEELNRCDALIVLCGGKTTAPLQVPLLVGYALARGLQVIWIGSSLQIASNHPNLAQFGTVEEFCDTFAIERAA
jgi:hypothetical protein